MAPSTGEPEYGPAVAGEAITLEGRADLVAQAEADLLYMEASVVTLAEIRKVRYGLDGPWPSGVSIATQYVQVSPYTSDFTADLPTPLVALPKEMANGVNQQIRTLSVEWREGFPGLQVKVEQMTAEHLYSAPNMKATVLFRLTPKDTQP